MYWKWNNHALKFARSWEIDIHDENWKRKFPTGKKPQQQSVPGTEKTPTLVEPLRDQTINEGSSIVFKCRVIGKPVPAAQWFKGPNIIKPSKFFQMSRDGEYYSLRITEAFPEDEGVYKCELGNSLGKIATSANLRVQAPEMQEALPTLSPMKDVIVQEGSPAQFKTTISGKTKPTNVSFGKYLLLEIINS